MRTDQYTVTARDVQLHTQRRLSRHLGLADHGRKCTAGVLYAVLCWADLKRMAKLKLASEEKPSLPVG